MISCEWTSIVRLGWPEIIRVPGCLDAIAGDIQGNAHESAKDCRSNRDTSGEVCLENGIGLDHHKEGTAGKHGERCSDVPFTAVLTTRAPHEVLSHDYLAILVLLHLENGHLVQDRVDDARRAEEVSEPGDSYPKELVEQDLLNGEEDADEHNNHCEQHQILKENDMEGILDRHIVDESLVNVVKQLLGASSIIFLYLP